MIISFKKRKLGLCTILIVLILLLVIIYYIAVGSKHKAAINIYEHTSEYTLIIDAGHGGADGGATSVTGIPESELNLEIAEKLEALTALYGISAVMTRTTEDIEYPSEANTIRAKKVFDTQNRVKIINGISNAVVISIHQNIYDNSSVSGPQVMFASTRGSEEFAKAVQNTLIATLEPSKTRAPSKVPSNVFIMNHIDCPAVLVECGFLSNYQDDQLLQSDSYQIKIAAALLSSYINSQKLFGAGGEAVK